MIDAVSEVPRAFNVVANFMLKMHFRNSIIWASPINAELILLISSRAAFPASEHDICAGVRWWKNAVCSIVGDPRERFR